MDPLGSLESAGVPKGSSRLRHVTHGPVLPGGVPQALSLLQFLTMRRLGSPYQVSILAC